MSDGMDSKESGLLHVFKDMLGVSKISLVRTAFFIVPLLKLASVLCSCIDTTWIRQIWAWHIYSERLTRAYLVRPFFGDRHQQLRIESYTTCIKTNRQSFRSIVIFVVVTLLHGRKVDMPSKRQRRHA